MNIRLAVYPVVVLIVAILLILPNFLLSPQRNITNVTNIASSTSSATTTTFSSFLKVFKNGYVLTFHTGNEPEYGDAEFVIITRRDDCIVVETINGPGPEGVTTFQGSKAKEFITRHNIDLNKLDSQIDEKN